MRKHIVMLTLWVLLATTSQAASFECAKAETKVELLICDDPEISKLDNELSRAYTTALKKYGQIKITKIEQAQWIKHRDACVSKGCLKALYQARLQELKIEPAQFDAMPPTVLVDTSDKPVFDNEADKLQFMRFIANQHAFESPEYPANSSFCLQFFDDFTKGIQMEAVEPDVRATDANDPQLEKWHQCEDKEIAPDGFENLGGLGGPPYRYYHIDVDGNPDNGKEDVIYTDYEKTSSGGIVGSNGFYWVDLKSCEFKGAAHLSTGAALQALFFNVYHLNSIVKYKNGYLAVDLSPSGRPAYSLHVSPIGGDPAGRLCLWLHQSK